MAIDLREFGAIYSGFATTITPDAVASGWKITPADTRFIRVAVGPVHEDTLSGPYTFRWVSADSNRLLILAYFDRPCRLTGTVPVAAATEGISAYLVDVVIDKPGMHWLEIRKDEQHDRGFIGQAAMPVHPQFVYAALRPAPVLGATSPPTTPGPADVHDLIYRGYRSMELREHDQAIAAFSAAIAADPKNAMAYANRGLEYYWKRQLGFARADLDEAYRLDPHNPVVPRGRGLLALEDNDLPGAIAAFTQSLDLKPEDTFTLNRRAIAYLRADDMDKALADYAAAINIRPDMFGWFADRAMIFRAQGKLAQSVGETQALVSANSGNPNAFIVAGNIDAASGQDAEATHAFDRAIELLESDKTYLARAEHWHLRDMDRKRADVTAALRVNPGSIRAATSLATIQSDAGDFIGALRTLDDAMASQANDRDLLNAHGIVNAKSGQQALADRDFSMARSFATTPVSLNNMCWQKAIAGVALLTALAECDAATAADPMNAGAFDSRGLVLLRLGRSSESITSYDRALHLRPLSAKSLYGRGLAEQRLGDLDHAKADFSAALRLDAHVAETFAEYGISR